MIPESITTHFFEFAHEMLAVHDETDSNFMHYIDMFSTINTESFYVIDIHKREFCYISPNASFLCGYTIDEALRLGYDFYPKIVHPADLQSVIKSHKAILRHLSAIGEKRDEIDYFSHTFRLQQKYSFLSKSLAQMVYHRIKPVWIDDKLRYFLCSVGCTVAKETGFPRVYYKDGLTYEEYSFITQRWKRRNIEPLTEREKAILMLARQGKNSKEIPDLLYRSYNTIRNQITALLQKLSVQSMQQAIIFASNHRMIFGPTHNIQKSEQIIVYNSSKRTRVLLSADRLQRIQYALDTNLSIRKVARQEGISEYAIRYWIKHGKLKK